MDEISTKPYLIRAIHQWAVDNGFTPHLAVAVDARTQVPKEYVRAGEIVLNVSPIATNNLHLDNDFIHFEARFGGVVRVIRVPVEQVGAIYARENGQGMAFEVNKPLAEIEGNGDEAVQFHLDDSDKTDEDLAKAAEEKQGLHPQAADGNPSAGDDSPTPPKNQPLKTKGHLTRIK